MNEENKVPFEGGDEPVNNKKNTDSPIVVFIMIVLVCAGFLIYEIVLPMLNKGEETTTTTTMPIFNKKETTTTESTTIAHKDSIINFNSVNSFANYVGNSKNEEIQGFGTILTDNGFSKLNYDVDDKCQNEGDKISFKSHGIDIEYTCTNQEVRETSYEKFCVWNVKVSINGVYKDEEDTTQTCQEVVRYTNGKYLLRIHQNCSSTLPMGITVVSLETGKEIYDASYYIYFYKDDKDYSNSTIKTPLIVKDNVLYFVETNDVMKKNTTCSIRYIDFNEETPKVIDLTKPIPCYSPCEQ